MLTIFVDESGADGTNRYLVHGALFVRHPALLPMRSDVDQRLRSYPFQDELKWSTTTPRRVARDIKAVSTFFEIYNTGGIESSPRFQCLVVDQHKLQTRHFHNGDSDMCFYKLLYQLLVKRIGEMADAHEQVHVVLDNRSTRRYDLNDLRIVLRNGLRKNLGWAAPNVTSVVYRDSKSEPLIQVTDFLTGAVGYHRNGHHLSANRAAAKWLASEWLARKVGIPTLAKEQHISPKFGIWTFRLRKRPPHRLAA